MDGFEIVLGAARDSRSAVAPMELRFPANDGGRDGAASVTPIDSDARAPAGLRLVSIDDTRGSVRAVVHPGVASTRGQGRSVRAALDVFVGGVNVTARVEADQAPCILRDLALAMVDLACGTGTRAVVRFYETPWELGLRRIDGAAGEPPMLSINVVRLGTSSEVAVYDRRARLEIAMRGTIDAIDALVNPLAGAFDDAIVPVLKVELSSAREALMRALPSVEARTPSTCKLHNVLATVDVEPGSPLSFGADLPLSVEAAIDDARGPIEASDLHAVLGRGRVRVAVAGRVRELGEVHVFLFAERLLLLCRPILESWQRGRAWQRKIDLLGPAVTIRLGTDGKATLMFTRLSDGMDDGGEAPTSLQTIVLDAPDLVDGIVGFCRSLTRAIVRRDRSQAHNLRLLSLRRAAREVGERLREVARPVGPFGESDLVSDRAGGRSESYRRYLQPSEPASRPAATPTPATAPAPRLPSVRKLRFAPRWTAEVPGIDLRATFLCGDRLILSGATETACVARDDGETLWKSSTVRATSLPTSGGLARLRGDGRLELRDFGDGSVLWSQACAPRSKGTPAACTVSAPGLPRLLIVSDGDRHVVAFDLASGAARWRFPLAKPGAIRMRRAGRLLVTASDESSLTAVDVVDGRVVWRVRDRLRFAAPPAIEREDLVAVAGEPSGSSRLYMIDASSGARRYDRPLFFSAATDVAPMLFPTCIVVLSRDRRGVGLSCFDRNSGVACWSVPTGAWPTGTSALAIDALIVLNLPTGEVLALHCDSGATAWRHVFEPPMQGDAPRRLEPVLRSGALFVPQDKVRVLRPTDGALIGVVAPSDLVPDLLRVDDRCDVYLAEESGHVAAYAASSKLELVDGGVSSKSHLQLVK
ncbi:MAG: PQQ-binding-like beta-propeller repeat protein [Polyangiales bacterium]